jgi:hypothetical protein
VAWLGHAFPYPSLEGLIFDAKIGDAVIVQITDRRPRPESCGPPLWRASAFQGLWVRLRSLGCANESLAGIRNAGRVTRIRKEFLS